MLQKFAALAVFALSGTALLVPDSSFAAGGGRGFGGGGFRAGGFHGRAIGAPFMGHRVGQPGFMRGPRIGVRPPPSRLVTPLPVRTHVGKPFAHLAQRHHHRHRSGYGYGDGWIAPYTTWDDGRYGYVGIPYDPGAAIPVYGPAPAFDPTADLPALRYAPRISGAPNDSQDACRAERVTVPAGAGEREITVVRC
jgi:hypothetical protein